jgi:prephenate dehydrogenase
MKNIKVAIIGLGLIGGSLARALRERTEIKYIVAVTPDTKAISRAVSDGVITQGYGEINKHVLGCDIIFICTPVNNAIEYLKVISGNVSPNCIVTDVCSTKEAIVNHVNSMPNAPCFVGGHPMTGTEKSGYAAGFAHLFENAFYILTPCRTSTKEAIDMIASIITTIGGIPIVLDAQEHDRITGSISHVPHILASALVNMVKDMDSPDGKMQMLAAGGFKDITRIASSNAQVWENIISSNKEHVKEILSRYIGILNEFIKNLNLNDSRSIYDFFETARKYRDCFPSNIKTGLLAPLHELVVDVVDKPGVIGEIATILGSNNINIKNINVSNSREYELGCLKITLPDSESVNKAFNLLQGTGYKVFKK